MFEFHQFPKLIKLRKKDNNKRERERESDTN